MLQLVERFRVEDAAALMRHPSITETQGDDMTPAPEFVDFESFLVQPDVLTYIAEWHSNPVGFCQLIQRNSIMAEMHVGFLPMFRGAQAGAFIRACLSRVFAEKGLIKVMAILPSDNRPALHLANVVGFRREGRLTRAVLRKGNLIDLIILGVSRNE